MAAKERVEHTEGKDVLDRMEDLVKRARRVAIRGLIQTAKAAEKLTPAANGVPRYETRGDNGDGSKES